MSSLATIRQATTARRALSVFVVLWLNLVLQPCAMAFGGDQAENCAKCPPAHSQQHGEHELAPLNMVEHGMPCADGSDNCGIFDELNYDGRTAQVKVKDAPDQLPLAVLPVAKLAWDINLAPRRHIRLKQNHPPGPPQALNKLYCVYLK